MAPYWIRLRRFTISIFAVLGMCWLGLVFVGTRVDGADDLSQTVSMAGKTAEYLEKQGHDALLHALVILSGLCVAALAAMVKVAYSVHKDVVALTRECNAASKEATAANVLLARNIRELTEELKARPCVADRHDRRDHR